MRREIEAALVQKLQELKTPTAQAAGVPSLQLIPFPDDPLELGRPFQSARVVVAYKGSSYQALQNDPLIWEQGLQFEISVYVKNLRTHTGVYPLLDRVNFLLAGWFCGSPDQKRPAFFQSDRYNDRDRELWIYNTTLIVPIQRQAGIEFGEIPGLDPISEAWEQLEQVEVVAGIWRSPIDAVGDSEVSTRDAEITLTGET